MTMSDTRNATSRVVLVVGACLWASCNSSSTAPTPAGSPQSFVILSSTPAFGGTVFGRGDSDLQGTTGFIVNFQVVSSGRPVYFTIELLNGSTECLRTQIAYSALTSSSGNTFAYTSNFFLRDNQQRSCGARFTTDRIHFILQSADPALAAGTGAPVITLFTQDVSGGWTFSFNH
jgi:hypothetical protein